MTGDPEGIVDGKQVGFSLDQIVLSPRAVLKTDTEVKHLLKSAGVWNEITGVNKSKMLAQVSKPISPAFG